MSNIIKAIGYLTVIGLASVATACVVAAVAHYSLNWDADRANAVGTTAASLVFAVGAILGGRR